MAGSNNHAGELKFLKLSDITENPAGLRPVDKRSEEYMGLVDSIRQKGILNPISVREIKNPETGKIGYAVVDGAHRYTASIDAGLTEIPCYIKNLKDAELLEAQIIANVHKVETKPAQYAQQLRRILTQNPTLTRNELAAKLGKTPAWLSKILGLVRITDDKIQSLVDEGKIVLSNAYALSDLPPEEQTNFIDRAMTMSPLDFLPVANARAKEIKDAMRQGKKVAPEQFVALPKLRTLKELKEEYSDNKVGPVLLGQLNITNPVDAWKTAVAWALQLDAKSVEVRKQKDAELKADREEKKKKAKAEREKKRQEEAARAVAELSS